MAWLRGTHTKETKMQLIQNRTILAITGISGPTFNTWLKDGTISGAVCGGEGRGNHRRWTVTQAVGIAVAIAMRSSERGCSLSVVSKIVEAFGAVTEEWLVKQFEAGNTHLVMLHHGKPLLQPKQYDWLDVQEIYQRVLKSVQ